MDPRVSVIVPTRERREQLRSCLAALAEQTLVEDLEVIVVDDVHGAGPSAARLRGAAVAQAPVLCFTDDDCEPEPGWAEALERAIAAGADAAVGRTVNAVDDSTLAETSQLVVNHLVERDPGYGTANNVAVRADVLDAVPFDAYFRFAGGDRDWCRRMRAAGRNVAYTGDAVVRHRHVLSARAFLRQHFAYGRGAYAFRNKHRAPLRRESPSLYTSLLARGWRAGPATALLVTASQLATAAGYVAAAVTGGARKPEA
jgi:glycosyltransferase involved in cell wall biosynthesis